AAAPGTGVGTGASAPSARREIGRLNRTTTRIQRAWRRTFRASSNRINLADDVDAERFEGDEVWNVGVETASRAEPLPEVHVVVVVHHLIAGHRLVAVPMGKSEGGVVV